MSADVPESPGESELLRQWQLFEQEVGPIAHDVLAAADPWDAYREANRAMAVLADSLAWLPHGGEVYVAWAVLTDLYEIGDTTPEAAHKVLQRAVAKWLERPTYPGVDFVLDWLKRTSNEARKVAEAPSRD